MKEIRDVLETYENKVRNTLRIGSEYKVATLSHQNETLAEIEEIIKANRPSLEELRKWYSESVFPVHGKWIDKMLIALHNKFFKAKVPSVEEGENG